MSEIVNHEGHRGKSGAWGADARFAVYYAPSRASAWWRAGCEWLERDAESGERFAPPQPPGLTRPLTELTAAPRRYGWHGTLLAPFRLAAGVEPDDVLAATRRWAAARRAFALSVEAASLGDFVALRPAGSAGSTGETAMRELAAGALQTLHALRATPSAEDLARRLAAPLTDRQRALLAEWGYPYVLDEFRFHMTLSNSLSSADERDALVAWWRQRTAAFGPLSVDHVALFVEPAPGAPFVLWQRVPFQNEEVSKA